MVFRFFDAAAGGNEILVDAAGSWSDLYVASVGTGELIVRSRDGSGDGPFDYIVFGLRIGFEDLPIVQPRQREAYLPPADSVQAVYAAAPGLRRFSARERFERMDPTVAGRPPDDSRSRALEAAINEGRATLAAQAAGRAGPERPRLPMPPAIAAAPAPSVTAPSPAGVADTPADPGVAGCAVAAEPGLEVEPGRVAVGSYGIVVCRADARVTPIRPGDLLVTSPTPGHAMRAAPDAGGAILGKAVDPLEAGTGLVRVLIALR